MTWYSTFATGNPLPRVGRGHDRIVVLPPPVPGDLVIGVFGEVRLARDPLPEPDGETLGVDLPAGNCQGDVLEFLVGRKKTSLVDLDEQFRRHRSHTFVAVNERMVHHERMHERRGLAGEIGVEILAAEGGSRPRDRRLQRAAISEPAASAEATDLVRVESKDLLHGQIQNHSASFR